MDKYACSFKLENLEFDVREQIFLNDEGNLIEYLAYLGEGPLSYTVGELIADPKFLQSMGGINLNIRLSKTGYQVIDNQKALTIERIFKKQKMLLMKQTPDFKKREMRILYEYK